MKQKQFKKGAIMSMTLLCIVGILPPTAQGEGNVFTDVSKDYWGYGSIAWATEQKVVDGYPDGTFKPEQTVTQTEFVAMLVRAYLNKDQLPEGNSSNWGAPYIKHAYNMGWAGSIVVPPSSKLNTDFNNVSESRKYVAKLITNANGRNYDFDDSIRFVLDSGLAEGKTDKSIEGFKGNDIVTRAEAVTFIKNLKAKQDMLYPSPQGVGGSYDPATLKQRPFEMYEMYPLIVDQPQEPKLLRYSNISLNAPTFVYNLVHEPSYKLEGIVTDAVGSDLTISMEYWDLGIFKPVTTIKALMINGGFSARLDFQKSGVYRMFVTSELEHDGKTYENKITLTSFYIEFKEK
ncbi:hypothetical protein QFZ81_004019 [Paenibacillus sp. V4I9]|uniref:S-layer homology domain-containing protein n=1 Tax=Paenibacillus sp. V4I9 TaxID=3042308 RepID=UPI00277F6555|nr:S-layer homology domain-containing protein [Paenibacillus sp. V4I9]MDQ0888931.1 hypothetical protein [Paenibacillus sp. V4I9]